MIIIVNTNSGYKKVIYRGGTFNEIGENNQKSEHAINTVVRFSTIKGVLWISGEGNLFEMPLEEWKKWGDAHNLWNQ